jgi:hypothetical protein
LNGFFSYLLPELELPELLDEEPDDPPNEDELELLAGDVE